MVYFVLDLSKKQVIVFRNVQEGKYLEEKIFQKGMITPLAFSGVLVFVKKLLPISLI